MGYGMLSYRRLMKWKIYLDRSKGYVGTVNMLLMGIVVLNTLPGGAGEYLREHYLVAYPGVFFLTSLITIIIGVVDDRLGLRKEELKNMFKADPLHVEMFKMLKRISDSKS